MIANIKARYANGVLTPLEPIDLEEGADVIVSVEKVPRDTGEQKEGPLLRILSKVQERHAALPPDTWDGLPMDLAKNKKHYLYGHPKEED